MLLGRRVVHARQGSDMAITNDGQSTTTQPEQAADARTIGCAVGGSGVTFCGAVGFGQDGARGAGSVSVVSVLEAVLLDNVVGSSTHVENDATRRSLIDAHADELFGFAFSSETHGSISTLKVGDERRDVLVSYSTCEPGKYFSCGTLVLVLSVARTMVMRAVPRVSTYRRGSPRDRRKP